MPEFLSSIGPTVLTILGWIFLVVASLCGILCVIHLVLCIFSPKYRLPIDIDENKFQWAADIVRSIFSTLVFTFLSWGCFTLADKVQ